jgi:hypothetical protein
MESLYIFIVHFLNFHTQKIIKNKANFLNFPLIKLKTVNTSFLI